MTVEREAERERSEGSERRRKKKIKIRLTHFDASLPHSCANTVNTGGWNTGEREEIVFLSEEQLRRR